MSTEEEIIKLRDNIFANRNLQNYISDNIYMYWNQYEDFQLFLLSIYNGSKILNISDNLKSKIISLLNQPSFNELLHLEDIEKLLFRSNIQQFFQIMNIVEICRVTYKMSTTIFYEILSKSENLFAKYCLISARITESKSFAHNRDNAKEYLTVWFIILLIEKYNYSGINTLFESIEIDANKETLLLSFFRASDYEVYNLFGTYVFRYPTRFEKDMPSITECLSIANDVMLITICANSIDYSPRFSTNYSLLKILIDTFQNSNESLRVQFTNILHNRRQEEFEKLYYSKRFDFGELYIDNAKMTDFCYAEIYYLIDNHLYLSEKISQVLTRLKMINITFSVDYISWLTLLNFYIIEYVVLYYSVICILDNNIPFTNKELLIDQMKKIKALINHNIKKIDKSLHHETIKIIEILNSENKL